MTGGLRSFSLACCWLGLLSASKSHSKYLYLKIKAKVETFYRNKIEFRNKIN